MKLIYLHGAPASGKLTVARAILQLLPGRLFDNHAAIDLARTVFDFGQEGFWSLVNSVRIETIRKAAQHNVPLLIYTSCYSGPEDYGLFQEMEAAVTDNNGVLLPVYLECSEQLLQERVGNVYRIERRKISSREGLIEFLKDWNMSPVPRANCLRLDSGAHTAHETAETIVMHFKLG